MSEDNKKIIHVNQHKIRSNHTHKKKGEGYNKTYSQNDYCHEVEIEGPCKVIYRPDDPLPCGARVWIETVDKVTCLVK